MFLQKKMIKRLITLSLLFSCKYIITNIWFYVIIIKSSSIFSAINCNSNNLMMYVPTMRLRFFSLLGTWKRKFNTFEKTSGTIFKHFHYQLSCHLYMVDLTSDYPIRQDGKFCMSSMVDHSDAGIWFIFQMTNEMSIHIFILVQN